MALALTSIGGRAIPMCSGFALRREVMARRRTGDQASSAAVMAAVGDARRCEMAQGVWVCAWHGARAPHSRGWAVGI